MNQFGRETANRQSWALRLGTKADPILGEVAGKRHDMIKSYP